MIATTNKIKRQKFSAWVVFLRQFKNPLLLVFIVSTIVAFVVGEKTEAFAIWIVMSLSIILGFWNEYQAEKVVNDLIKRISFTVSVKRNGVEKIIPVAEIQLNDEVFLHSGSIIPADIRISISEGLEVNESVITGESLPVPKKDGDPVYMGTVVTSGNAHGVVTAIGMDTKYGKISGLTDKARPLTEFQKGLQDFSLLLAKIAGVTVVLVIGFGYFLHHPIVDTVLFALTVAMGITPELLPLIVTLSLSYGSKKLAKKDLIVKQFVSIEDIGNMEVLCTDKTGTLTEGKISLSLYQDKSGKENPEVLSLGLICNSGFTHGYAAADSIDKAIIDFAESKGIKITNKPEKLYEMPFNFENRFMSIAIKRDGKVVLICKGSPEAIIARLKLDDEEKKKLESTSDGLQKNGLRVIAVASKEIVNFDPKLIKSEFKDLKFGGFMSFADVPKKDLAEDFRKFDIVLTNPPFGSKIKVLEEDRDLFKKNLGGKYIFYFNEE